MLGKQEALIKGEQLAKLRLPPLEPSQGFTNSFPLASSQHIRSNEKGSLPHPMTRRESKP